MKYTEWFALFVEECRKLGYGGPILIDGGFEDWYEDGQTPESAAKMWIEEMG